MTRLTDFDQCIGDICDVEFPGASFDGNDELLIMCYIGRCGVTRMLELTSDAGRCYISEYRMCVNDVTEMEV